MYCSSEIPEPPNLNSSSTLSRFSIVASTPQEKELVQLGSQLEYTKTQLQENGL